MLTSWGLYPKVENSFCTFQSKRELVECLKKDKVYIPYGNGRSYGDSALNKDIIYCRPYNYFLDFDEKNGILHTQSGVLLSEILDIVVPKGWFLEVTPGTKYITVGGAIASDVHGKNHHIAGCFSQSVLEFNLMLPTGEVVNVKPEDELFRATCGGMGLTGVILDAKIKLKKINSTYINQTAIKTKNLQETFEYFERYKDSPYSVAWIDCLSKDIGKSILFVGDFLNDGMLEYKKKKTVNVPFFFPSFTLNKFSVKIFNFLYYNKIREEITSKTVDIDTFFYPLDSIDNWNRIYGKQGFLQYQFILPKKTSYEGLEEILYEIYKSGKGSFLAVLKLYGKENDNYLSFPMEGYSLALDFKIESGLFELLEKLDKIVVKYGGRIYLAKDSRVSREVFEVGYPKVEKFREIRKIYGMDKKFSSLQSRRLGL
ncbi:MAG: FAD-binding oxidoreductase [Sulfurihydrogenibium sp.]|jgi:FAD/FMN-containing dehydrogenase|uniref:FAD-binding oxidoreductase n=1 Tax=Sulfurihydrogenibium sp. TaxID=2053621 RepID=UPI003C7DC37A